MLWSSKDDLNARLDVSNPWKKEEKEMTLLLIWLVLQLQPEQIQYKSFEYVKHEHEDKPIDWAINEIKISIVHGETGDKKWTLFLDDPVVVKLKDARVKGKLWFVGRDSIDIHGKLEYDDKIDRDILITLLKRELTQEIAYNRLQELIDQSSGGK